MDARWLRHFFNVYPPYLGAGVHVDEIAPDWRYLRVRMPLRWYNRNYVGSHFGGSLYSMTDPFFMIMVMKNLGPEFVVWDRAAEIEFVSPGRGIVTAEFRLTVEDLDNMRRHTSGDAKHLCWLSTDVRARDGTVVARVRKQLYIRRRRKPGPREDGVAASQASAGVGPARS